MQHTVCSGKGDPQYVVLLSVGAYPIAIPRCLDQDFGFQIYHPSRKVYQFVARDDEEREQWMDNLRAEAPNPIVL